MNGISLCITEMSLCQSVIIFESEPFQILQMGRLGHHFLPICLSPVVSRSAESRPINLNVLLKMQFFHDYLREDDKIQQHRPGVPEKLIGIFYQLFVFLFCQSVFFSNLAKLVLAVFQMEPTFFSLQLRSFTALLSSLKMLFTDDCDTKSQIKPSQQSTNTITLFGSLPQDTIQRRFRKPPQKPLFSHQDTLLFTTFFLAPQP